ncbi:hypothetical protein B4073_2345 [Bacillus subtilis]|nr:hypothetical protein B4068_2383 [Bacillus subtilis]KIN47053.1 hypothetical protein B4145_2325 [Bacillus subtilis]KIN51828.1 hypothetical protein B4073_2345 [Bacillus subtilis]
MLFFFLSLFNFVIITMKIKKGVITWQKAKRKKSGSID